MDYTNFYFPGNAVAFSAIEGFQRSGGKKEMVKKIFLMEYLMEYEMVQHILAHINTFSRI